MLVYTPAHTNFKIAIVEVTLKYGHIKVFGKFLPYNKPSKAHLLISVLGLIQNIPKNNQTPLITKVSIYNSHILSYQT